jgi:sialate O-acetylesterase
VWVNGKLVGATDGFGKPRVYKIPADILLQGENSVAVRVMDVSGNGGFAGPAEQMKLTVTGLPPVALDGIWRYKTGADLTKTPAYPRRPADNPNVPTVLYNAMVAPLVPYGIKGAIWYQGESNASRAMQYRQVLPTLIKDWRARFGQGDFPFYIVQLANFMPRAEQPGDSEWAELREAQALTAKNVPNSGLAVAIDIGEAGDIHPRNKQDVGKRLALEALAKTYKQPIVSSGPDFREAKVEGHAIRLSFDHVGGGLEAKDGVLKGFAIAGADKNFVWADAEIHGGSVVVSSPRVQDPVAVRYAWANNPEATLFNKEGLPAIPFRTDEWPGVTEGKR